MKLALPAIAAALLAVYMAAWPVRTERGMKILLARGSDPRGVPVETVSMLDGGRTGLYYDVGERVGQLRPDAGRVVLLGMGGGEMLRAARRTLPSAELVGVEVSAMTAAIARGEFGIEQLGVHVVVDDAAGYVDQVPAGSVDAYLVDIFDDATLPLYFRSPVFFRACRRGLAPRGLLIMNVWPPTLAAEVSSAMLAADFSGVRFEFAAGGNVEVFAER